MSWKSEAAKLKAWLGPQRGLTGAKDFLRVRMGLRPAMPWTPGMAFGLSVDEPETMAAPTQVSGAADASGDAIQTQN